MAVRSSELKALIALLECDWEDVYEEDGTLIAKGVERLAHALIQALDEARSSRTSYVAVVQIGGKDGIYTGIGPYPGAKSAMRALIRHPVLSDPTLNTGSVVVPLDTPLGFEKRLKDLDTPPKKKKAS